MPDTFDVAAAAGAAVGSAAPLVGVGSLLAERYRLERVVGDGGSATVYRGTDTALQRPVAVKVFRSSGDGIVQARRERELFLASGFLHPNLVAVYDAHLASEQAGSTAGSGAGPTSPPGFLVCEYVDGQSLAQRLDNGPLPDADATKIGIGIAQALAVLHRADVVHRDVKPGNVLLERETGRAKLSDFGIARDLKTDPVTRTMDVLGTAPYLSPEQARGETVGPPTDIYALGLVLLECLTGRREYKGEPIPAAVARLIRDPRVPVDLAAPWPNLLRRMTSRNPEQRPTADDVAVILAHRPHGAVTNPPWISLDQQVPDAPAARTPWHRRRGWSLAAAAGAALLLLTAGIADSAANRDPAADPPAAAPVIPTPSSTVHAVPPTPPTPPKPSITGTPSAAIPSPTSPATVSVAHPAAIPPVEPSTADVEPAPAVPPDAADSADGSTAQAVDLPQNPTAEVTADVTAAASSPSDGSTHGHGNGNGPRNGNGNGGGQSNAQGHSDR